MLRESLLTNVCISLVLQYFFFLFSLHALHGTTAPLLHISSSANIAYAFLCRCLMQGRKMLLYLFLGWRGLIKYGMCQYKIFFQYPEVTGPFKPKPQLIGETLFTNWAQSFRNSQWAQLHLLCAFKRLSEKQNHCLFNASVWHKCASDCVSKQLVL